ncbi:MAG: hypothetical protein GXY08_00125, partial [Ruminococcus sp.]|nr:hypothetical protein [Ruminococcus sp.]
MLINTEGETLWDADKDGMEYGSKRWGEEGVKSIVIGNQCDGNAMDKEDALGGCLYKKNMAFEGYALVQYDIDTFEYTGKAFGFLAPDGTWMLDPIETGWTMKYFVG